MQTLEPPYSFWPASYHPEGVDGQHFDVFDRSGLARAGLDLSDAMACNQRFNPFNPDDSLCLGTSKLKRLLNAARAWITAHARELGVNATDRARSEGLTVYVLGHMYAGTWFGSAVTRNNHPRCSDYLRNGDCWSYGFAQSAAVTDAYCGSDDGKTDGERCGDGQPLRSPPDICYGYTDFPDYVKDCEIPFLSARADPGASVLTAYLQLRSKCRR
jgi:hypothetical protein